MIKVKETALLDIQIDHSCWGVEARAPYMLCESSTTEAYSPHRKRQCLAPSTAVTQGSVVTEMERFG